MPAVKVLTDHTAKLRADNEYLERQIAFLAQRITEYKIALDDNRRCIQSIEATLGKIVPDRCPLDRL